MTEDEGFQTIFDELCSPFPSEEIEWRIGATNQDKSKGMALAYIDARAVMDRLDRVLGPENWQCSYSHANGKTVCDLAIRIDNGWVSKADGAGDTDHEAEKGALSDAFKRAAVRWGVGRYLYDVDSPWVAIAQRGRSYVIADGEIEKLNAAHEKTAQRQQWGDRSHQNLYRALIATVQQFVSGEMVDQFIDQNKGQFAQLPAALKRQLWQELQRIKDGYQAVAAE